MHVMLSLLHTCCSSIDLLDLLPIERENVLGNKKRAVPCSSMKTFTSTNLNNTESILSYMLREQEVLGVVFLGEIVHGCEVSRSVVLLRNQSRIVQQVPYHAG